MHKTVSVVSEEKRSWITLQRFLGSDEVAVREIMVLCMKVSFADTDKVVVQL